MKDRFYLVDADEVDSTKEIGRKLYPHEFFLLIMAKDITGAKKKAEKYLNDSYYDWGLGEEYRDVTDFVKNMDEDYEDGFDYLKNHFLTDEGINELEPENDLLYYLSEDY